ncbi:MAG TPA: NAD(P)H-dependent glycerol-3-phosphate dehydrogenase [Candidatus Monoglobus merdigallinarum]|uniref:Glycerol-3-phosphate dehydrogenase [NAD(P)+] n=1 Tax=Candidatus Monoglobus merdigallinarum TaxID=2838698 RepID=A0A9D1TLD6_9FIRM|nr:NAD(P)H-dependent glycerol-3-phosphate dehydrogenase [Candidatus Monoglobus merdigallinarum]
MANISVIGSGGWGSAMAIMLAEHGHNIMLWSYLKEECEDLKKYRENKPYLPGVKFPDGVEFTHDIEKCCRNTDIIITATPSHAVRATARSMAGYVRDGQIIVNISKGIEEGTYYTLSQVIREEIPGCTIAVMSGPSHAEEVSRKVPTTNVVACESEKTAEYIQDAFMNPNFRIYTNPDVLGVELGGSLKNVIALCAGIIDGMGLGDNTKAALMTRGLVEMSRLGAAMGANPETFNGLSGVGDLIVTCTSMHSRNRRAGILIGQGKTPEEAKNEVKMVVEGIRTCRAAKELSDKVGVEMPIVNEAYKVLFNGLSPQEAIKNLMGRDKKHESERSFLGTK